ncbi:MAG: hypothetical protein HQK75_12400 [Candidatus Magnetomorum sp.]|nr:hypothetical protein [Candidatus Magnetomorum sp.]
MKKIYSTQSMRFSKAFFMISLITIAAIIGLGIRDYSNRLSGTRLHLESSFEATTQKMSKILVTPLWNLEIKRLKNIAQAEIIAGKYIDRIVIHENTIDTSSPVVICISKDSSGQLINCQGKPSDRFILKSQKLVWIDIPIGQLDIYFSQSTVDQETRAILKDVLMKRAILIMIFIAGLYLAIRSLRGASGVIKS